MAVAVIDNWQLDLVGDLMAGREAEVRCGEYQTVPLGSSDPIAAYQAALCQVLDTYVTHDKLIVSADCAWSWRGLDGMSLLSSSVLEVNVPSDTQLAMSRQAQEDLGYNARSHERPAYVVADRAFYYLQVARCADANYWPSPWRAKFLSRLGERSVRNSAVSYVRGQFEPGLMEAVAELVHVPGTERSEVRFPGFGEAVLAQCSCGDEVFLVASQLRESRECRAFQEWLAALDNALTRGDTLTVAACRRDIEDALAISRLEPQTPDKSRPSPTLELGFWPRIAGVPLAAIWSGVKDVIRRHVTPRKLHVSFLRKHMDLVAANTRFQYHFNRLFPGRFGAS